MENELERVVDALPGLVWTALPDGQIDFLNQRWCEYTGLSVAEARGRGWQTAIHPEDMPSLLERWRSILASGEPGEMEARLQRFDGEYRWFVFRASPLADASGQVVKWCGVNTDVDHRRRDVETLRSRENHYRSIADSIPALIAFMTPAGEVESVNRHVLDYFGATLEELKGWAVGDTVHPDDLPAVIAAWMRAVDTGEPYDIEHRIRRADGIYRWFHARGLPLRDTQGSVVRWYVLETDIDDRKRAEALLAGEKRLLEMIATGQSLSATFTELCLLVEKLCPNCVCCSILLLDAQTNKLWHAASPSVPRTYTESIDGFTIGPEVSCCGTAAYHRKQIIASDIATDPRWTEFRGAALENGLKACWSTPIFSQQNTVLGTFAMFSGKPGNPTAEDQDVIAQITHLASIAIERERSDTALKRSEARKAAILDSALDCIVTIDHLGRLTEFNPAAERVFGYRRDETMGKHLADVIIPRSLREQHRLGFARYLATSEARVLGKRIEMTAARADGSEFPVELAITRIPLDGPPSFTGYLRDITERKRSEEELRRSAAYLAEAQKLSLTGSFGWGVSTDEHFWSDQTFRIFEYDVSTTVTLQLILERIHPQDVPFVRQAIAQAADGRDLDYECRLLMPGGSVKHIHIVGHGILDHDGRLEYIGAVQDVTQRRLSEEALGKARSDLARVARVSTLGALTASIAHEVNQPLSGIITNASTCLRMLAADPPNVEGARETARRTIRDGNRASDVITRLRALFSKKEMTTESVDLNEAAREVIALSRSELQRGRVIVQPELADDLPPVTGDRVQLQQVILNLLLNASDAMSGVDDRPRQLAIRTARDDGDAVRLSVQDAGVGFELHAAEKLFQAFYTTKNGGMGIGLSVSRSIIESHHGRLWAAPNEGPGATFSFSIPVGPQGVTITHNVGAIRKPSATDAPRPMRSL